MPAHSGSRQAQVTGRYYVHRLLWSHFDDLSQLGSEAGFSPALGTAMLLTLHCALEAYLNYLGSIVAATAWQSERTKFHGPIDKLEYLLGELAVDHDKGKRPFQTVLLLNRKRNILAHGRTEVVDETCKVSEHARLPGIMPRVTVIAPRAFLSAAELDVEKICDQLHAAAQRVAGVHLLEGTAFRGILGHQQAAFLAP